MSQEGGLTRFLPSQAAAAESAKARPPHTRIVTVFYLTEAASAGPAWSDQTATAVAKGYLQVDWRFVGVRARVSWHGSALPARQRHHYSWRREVM